MYVVSFPKAQASTSALDRHAIDFSLQIPRQTVNRNFSGIESQDQIQWWWTSFGKWWTAQEPFQSSWCVSVAIKKITEQQELKFAIKKNNYLNIFPRWEELSQQLGWALQRAQAAGSGYNWAEIGLPWQCSAVIGRSSLSFLLLKRGWKEAHLLGCLPSSLW